MEDETTFQCIMCEGMTCKPPDDLLEFEGMCPGCVVKTQVLPLVKHEGVRKLVTAIIEHNCADEMSIIAIPGNALGTQLDDLIQKFFDNPEVKRRLLDLVVKTEDHHVNRPVVRNDPRTG